MKRGVALVLILLCALPFGALLAWQSSCGFDAAPISGVERPRSDPFARTDAEGGDETDPLAPLESAHAARAPRWRRSTPRAGTSAAKPGGFDRANGLQDTASEVEEGEQEEYEQSQGEEDWVSWNDLAAYDLPETEAAFRELVASLERDRDAWKPAVLGPVLLWFREHPHEVAAERILRQALGSAVPDLRRMAGGEALRRIDDSGLFEEWCNSVDRESHMDNRGRSLARLAELGAPGGFERVFESLVERKLLSRTADLSWLARARRERALRLVKGIQQRQELDDLLDGAPLLARNAIERGLDPERAIDDR